MFREQMSGHVMLTGGSGLLAPAAAAVGLPSVFHMPHAMFPLLAAG